MKRLLSPRPAIILLIPVLLLLSACIPDSEHPLPPPADDKGDDRLIGRWIFGKEGEEFADIAAVVGYHYKVRMVSFKEGTPSDSPDMVEFDILTTHIGENRYMTLAGLDELKEHGPDNPLHLILRYGISSDGLMLVWPMNMEAVREDMGAGRIAGQINQGDDIRLTAGSAELEAYIAESNIERLFRGNPFPMRRQ